MKIGIKTSHMYAGGGMGGGYQAVKWHILAARELGHSVTVHTTNSVGKIFLDNWFDGVSLRYYLSGVEKEYDCFINVDHFAPAQPLAGLNINHTFFPMPNVPQPDENVRLYSNSAYTARHIKHNWGRDAVPLYIPIDKHFHSGDKAHSILHVSRFSEPSVYADKGHRQMIQAFKMMSRRLPGWKLVLVGSVDPQMEWYLDSLAKLSAGYDIDIMPNVSNEKMAELYASSALYWHATGVSLPTIPSAQEHMGIAPLEAQASGCVPIVYNSGGMPEVVRANETGILFDNIADLPQMTLSLMDNWAMWSKMSQAGQLWASSWMNWENFVSRVDDMLNDRPLRPMMEWKPALKYGQQDLTIVIPTYNSSLLDGCIESIRATAPNVNIIIVNNGEADNTRKYDESCSVLYPSDNLGYAGGMIFANDFIKTPLAMAMNDDVVCRYPGWAENCLLLFNRPEVGVVGPKLLFGDGRVQFAGGEIDWNRSDVGFHRGYGQPDGVELSVPTETQFVTGAALMCRRELFSIPEELANLYNYEDTNLCFEARKKGYKVIYQPAAVLTHFEGETKKRNPIIEQKVSDARKWFIDKWYHP